MEHSYRKIIEYLHSHGVDRYVDLPQIAVIGDTSSGKSSLLSAISTIQFPSSDEITTRCPVRLRMEHTPKLAALAKISIKWVSCLKHVGKDEWSIVELTDLSKIPEVIKAAQCHILSRSQSDVSPDVIEVSISGPDFLDITIVDLPGFFASICAGIICFEAFRFCF